MEPQVFPDIVPLIDPFQNQGLRIAGLRPVEQQLENLRAHFGFPGFQILWPGFQKRQALRRLLLHLLYERILVSERRTLPSLVAVGPDSSLEFFKRIGWRCLVQCSGRLLQSRQHTRCP